MKTITKIDVLTAWLAFRTTGIPLNLVGIEDKRLICEWSGTITFAQLPASDEFEDLGVIRFRLDFGLPNERRTQAIEKLYRTYDGNIQCPQAVVLRRNIAVFRSDSVEGPKGNKLFGPLLSGTYEARIHRAVELKLDSLYEQELSESLNESSLTLRDIFRN